MWKWLKGAGFNTLILVTLVFNLHFCHSQNRQCNETLGLESGKIENQALSASSSYDEHSTGPHNARLNHDKLGGAWCPKNTIQEGIREWIQIDLKQTHTITGIVTQGRYGRGTGQEYLKHFKVEYNDGRSGSSAQWKVYSDQNSHQVFNGSRDTITPVYQSFSPPISASQIRVVPFSQHPRVVCLRLELHGCRESNGITAYSSPVPDLLGNGSNQQVLWEEEQHQGLLTDGSFGLQDIHTDSILTYEDGWMSWKRKGEEKPVELVFKFESPRQFKKVHLFTANLLHLDTQVFRKAVIWFSIGGTYFNQDPITYTYMADTILREPRNVSIRLNGRVGAYVKLHLYFSNIWMSISEVTFDSHQINSQIASERPPGLAKAAVSSTETTTEDYSSTAQTELPEMSGTVTGMEGEVLIGILTAVTLILLGLFLVILVYSKHRQKFHQSPATTLNPYPAVQINMKELLTGSPVLSGGQISPNPINVNAEFEDYMGGHQRSKWHSTGHMDYNPRTFRTSNSSVVKPGCNITSNPMGSEYASVDIQNIGNGHYRSLQERPGLPPAAPPGGGGAPATATGTYNLGHFFPRVSSEPPSRKSYQAPSANRNGDPLKPLPMAETQWNFTTTVQNLCKQQSSGQQATLAEIPRNKLRLKESFGRGCLGEALICEIDSDYSNLPQPVVAVRSGLAGHLSDSIDRQEFLRESRLLSTLRHTNVVKLVGVAISEEPYCTILEHSVHGDLYHYLRQMSKIVGSSGSKMTAVQSGCNSSTSSTSGCSSGSPMMNSCLLTNHNVIHYANVVDFSAQIASGMKYLETRNIVHKDLAARNCLLCDNNVVKITDVAMGISLFNSDYSEVRGRSCAPIRWQPWETLLLGRLSTQSNVWSFGITVWELLTLCRQRPFALLTDIEVLQNAEHAYYNEGLQVELSQPESCERDIWELLEECWNREEEGRPTFSEISMFLKRKSLATSNEVENK